ncbi:DUF397 domain-containing protein [Streptomyces niger]|uniref:DUF397 domain-containing protein n=1 Tax=Streptomyces niger TaxID=66373 RepID=UPI00069C845E|nr:DUF397 domain-containing protein [Streptomyces niger]
MSTELVWVKSSYSGTNGGDCIEIAAASHTETVHVRDSKDIRGPRLSVSHASWADFLVYVRAGAGQR